MNILDIVNSWITFLLLVALIFALLFNISAKKKIEHKK